MVNEIVKYALFSNFFKDSVLDCFYPFFLVSMKKDKTYTAETLQRTIKTTHNLDMPIHVVRSLVNFGIEKKHLDHNGTIKSPFPVFITSASESFLATCINIEDVKRDITFLENKIMEYFQANAIDLPSVPIIAKLEGLLGNNIIHFCDFFLGRIGGGKIDGIDKHDVAIIDFISVCERQEPTLFEIIKNVFYGSLYKSFLSLTEKEAQGVITADYSRTKIYFDANFLFSLLELHDEEYSKPALELFHLLEQNRFQFRVYDFTIDEMIHVLRGYRSAKNYYPESVRVNSLYSSLKRKMYDDFKITELILDIPQRLSDLKIIKKTTGINIDKFSPQDPQISTELKKIKPRQPPYYHNHDAAVIDKSRKYHKSRIYKFEDMDSIFLTADFLLAKLGRQYNNHDSAGSVSEIFLDRVLTNLLFFKNPKSRVSMNSILSVFKRETFIKRSVWENFYDSLKRLIENGRIDQNSVVNLFYNNFIEKELRYITDQDAETLDDDKVIELLDSANKKSSESAQKSREQFNEEITLKEKEFRDKILSISSDGEDRLAKERRQTIEVLEFRSRRLAHRVVFSIRILAGLLLILPIYPLIGQIKNNGVTYDLPAITRYVFFVLDTIAISIGELWHKLENRIYKKRLKKELQNFKIEHQM